MANVCVYYQFGFNEPFSTNDNSSIWHIAMGRDKLAWPLDQNITTPGNYRSTHMNCNLCEPILENKNNINKSFESTASDD